MVEGVVDVLKETINTDFSLGGKRRDRRSSWRSKSNN